MPRNKLPKKIYDLPFRDSIVIPLITECPIYITCNECNQPMKPIGEIEDPFVSEIIIKGERIMAKEIVLGCKECKKTITIQKLN